MKVLMLGGTGVISTDIAELSVRHGCEVTITTRGNRPAPAGVECLQCDVHDSQALEGKVRNREFDVVADFLSFTPQQLTAKLRALRGHYGQYIFLSSCAVYDRGYGHMGGGLSAIACGEHGRISEAHTPTANFGWDYARNKIACEHELLKEHLLYGSRFTIVRPAETYNRRRVPGTFVCDGRWYTQIDRILKGKPVIVHDDGSARCPFTHAEDFAKGFVGLYCNPAAYGEAFHITTDELLTWRQVAQTIASELGVEANICCISTEKLVKAMPVSNLGDTYGMLACAKAFDCPGYDNAKIRSAVPGFLCEISFREGVRRILEHYATHPEERTVDETWGRAMDSLAEIQGVSGA